MSRFAIFLTAVICLLFVAMAAPLSIGFIKSTGDFRVDGSTIRQNGTVFDGNLIETTAARSVIELASVANQTGRATEEIGAQIAGSRQRRSQRNPHLIGKPRAFLAPVLDLNGISGELRRTQRLRI